MGFEEVKYEVWEDGGEVEVCLNKSTEVDVSFQLRITTSPVSAQGNVHLTGGKLNRETKLKLMLFSPSLLPFLPFSSFHLLPPPLLSSPSSPPPPFTPPSLSYLLHVLLFPLPSPSPQLTQTTFPSPKWSHASQGVARCVSPLPYSTTPL